jgi:hypothetical protein
MLAGCLALLAGAVVTVAAIETALAAAFLVGIAVAGAGFGTATLGALRTVSARAAPDQRARLIAAIFIVRYLAFSVPWWSPAWPSRMSACTGPRWSTAR